MRVLITSSRMPFALDAIRKLGQAAAVPQLHSPGWKPPEGGPQTKASEMLVPTPRPDIPDLATVALPVRFGDERPAPRRPPPRVGEHTVDILGELGFGAVEMGELRVQGAVDWPLPE